MVIFDDFLKFLIALNALELQKILKYDVRNIEKDYFMLKLQLIPLHTL